MECDYLIIGGGSAGAIIARRLADANIGSVILLEAGRNDEGDPAMVDLSRLDDQTDATDWGFRASTFTGGPADLNYPRARVLGGCGNHNDCAFLVPPDSDFDTWVQLGAAGWGADEVRPYFQRVDDMTNVEYCAPLNPVSQAFLQAGRELGLSDVAFRDRIAPGVGAFPLNARGKFRQSSSVAYLHPVCDRTDNLEVLFETMATRLLFEGRVAAGCETSRGAIRARREVILTAGSVQSPQLLMVSGLGPAGQLSDQGIPVIADMPGIGQHLLDHVASTVAFDLREAIPPWEMTPCEVAMILQVEDDASAPDVLVHLVLRMREKYTAARRSAPPENGIKVGPNVMRPKSEGDVRLASGDMRDAPVINLNYLSDPEGHDMRVLIKGTRACRALMETPTFQRIARCEVAPGPDIHTDDELAGYIRATCETVYHPSGTCRMGAAGDKGTVVTPDLKMPGIGRLRICDASVFPAMVSVNINNTVMMVAERAADLIIAGAKA